MASTLCIYKGVGNRNIERYRNMIGSVVNNNGKGKRRKSTSSDEISDGAVKEKAHRKKGRSVGEAASSFRSLLPPDAPLQPEVPVAQLRREQK